ncbi:MAG: hypothetical protein COA58_16405 [Bacteroidetes bacterium]|nr:MAG: hypothetical protein COA58_16405 [Bacteroidota bacterium]
MLEQYFTKITLDEDYRPYELGSVIQKNTQIFPDLKNISIAILGVVSDLHTNGCSNIRKELYKLVTHTSLETKIADLGDITEGATPAETHLIIKSVTKELQQKKILTILLGTSLDQGEALYHSFENTETSIETSLISSHLPLLEYQLLRRICTYKPNYLSNINAIAFQSHYIPPKALDTLENLNFGHLRLGTLKSDIEESEIYLRNSEVVLFDLNAIKHCDAPATTQTQPNGLTGEEACQISRYAGVSDSTKCFGIFEYYPENDKNHLTAKTIAQLLWYFLDGFVGRANDAPQLHDEFVKYRCDINDNQPPILFLKSKRTNRWWMQIEHPTNPSEDKLKLTFPCSYLDYQFSASGELPQRYMNAIKRLQ